MRGATLGCGHADIGKEPLSRYSHTGVQSTKTHVSHNAHKSITQPRPVSLAKPCRRDWNQSGLFAFQHPAFVFRPSRGSPGLKADSGIRNHLPLANPFVFPTKRSWKPSALEGLEHLFPLSLQGTRV
ncbi:hypothetical protein CapIbe_013563 [Capra ibex]